MTPTNLPVQPSTPATPGSPATPGTVATEQTQTTDFLAMLGQLVAASLQRSGAAAVPTGKAPAMAVRIRDFLGEILGPQYGQILERLGSVRERLKRQYPDFAQRREAWYRLLDAKVMPQLRRGEMPRLDQPDSRETAG